jgi:hypothetical protein
MVRPVALAGHPIVDSTVVHRFLGLLESQRPFDQSLQAIVLRAQAFIQPFDAYVLFYAIPEYVD